MKNFVLTVFFAMVITTGVFCQNGVIREMTGEVELKRAGSSNFVKASAGDAVMQNTIVSTGFRSTAIIVVGSSVITVRPLTRLSLAEIQTAQNSEKVNVNLQSGRVKVDVKPPSGTRASLSVQSPSATASVRGTEFEMDVDRMNVISGKVIYKGTNGTAVIVTGGNASLINKDSSSANPSDIAVQSLAPNSPAGTSAPAIVSQTAENPSGNLLITVDYGEN